MIFPIQSIQKRRNMSFAFATISSGLSIVLLCTLPLFCQEFTPQSAFPIEQQEEFFFDMFGFISGCWLLSFVAALNSWSIISRLGQWLGIILLCLEQVTLLEVWKFFSDYQGHASFISALAPALLQWYVVGLFFGFFTLPALVKAGNTRLTGLVTLMLLLPWLLAKNEIVLGTRYLSGL